MHIQLFTNLKLIIVFTEIHTRGVPSVWYYTEYDDEQANKGYHFHQDFFLKNVL